MRFMCKKRLIVVAWIWHFAIGIESHEKPPQLTSQLKYMLPALAGHGLCSATSRGQAGSCALLVESQVVSTAVPILQKPDCWYIERYKNWVRRSPRNHLRKARRFKYLKSLVYLFAFGVFVKICNIMNLVTDESMVGAVQWTFSKRIGYGKRHQENLLKDYQSWPFDIQRAKHILSGRTANKKLRKNFFLKSTLLLYSTFVRHWCEDPNHEVNIYSLWFQRDQYYIR